jgi:hypothetical protein
MVVTDSLIKTYKELLNFSTAGHFSDTMPLTLEVVDFK